MTRGLAVGYEVGKGEKILSFYLLFGNIML